MNLNNEVKKVDIYSQFKIYSKNIRVVQFLSKKMLCFSSSISQGFQGINQIINEDAETNASQTNLSVFLSKIFSISTVMRVLHRLSKSYLDCYFNFKIIKALNLI